MTHQQALARAIAALREQVKQSAATSNLVRYGSTSPEVIRADKDRRLNLTAIEMLQQDYELAKIQSKARRQSKPD